MSSVKYAVAFALLLFACDNTPAVDPIDGAHADAAVDAMGLDGALDGAVDARLDATAVDALLDVAPMDATRLDAVPSDPPDAAQDAALDLEPPQGGDPCGFEDRGRLLQINEQVQVCAPPVVCNAETCPPPLGACVDGRCEYVAGYRGLQTHPEAWATHYCDLASGGCHGVTQVEFPEITTAQIADHMGLPHCFEGGGERCVGIMAAPPMMVGNSQEAVDPRTGERVAMWGLGMTEATGFCYEITGPGGSAVLAITDRCGGYCTCGGSGFQECGPCVNAVDMAPHCSCVGPVPGLYDECCGLGCPTLRADCDWCASNTHPHFDLDTASFNWVCGADAINGSCVISQARYVPCTEAKVWPPGGGTSACPASSFMCPEGSPAPEQPEIPGTGCCCNWGLTVQPDQSCG